MPRKKKSQVEIVPRSEKALVPAPPTETPQAMLERIVRERVDEVMAERNAGQLEPDFRTREVANEIMRRQTMFERKRWAIYFEKHGCRRCDTTEVAHASGGYCSRCEHLLWGRLQRIKRDYDKANTEQDIQKQIDAITSRRSTARALLGKGDE